MHKEAVLISIRPKYAGEIFHGHKNMELRKTRPTELPLPFKAYVYCTQRQYTVMDVVHKGECVWNEDDIWESDTPLIIKIDKNTPDNMIDRLKMVVGVITVDKILEIDWKDGKSLINGRELTKEDDLHTCVTVKEFLKYKGNGTVYGWHISDYTYFVKPRPLSMFCVDRPPQSWQYLRASDPWDVRDIREETHGI